VFTIASPAALVIKSSNGSKVTGRKQIGHVEKKKKRGEAR